MGVRFVRHAKKAGGRASRQLPSRLNLRCFVREATGSRRSRSLTSMILSKSTNGTSVSVRPS